MMPRSTINSTFRVEQSSRLAISRDRKSGSGLSEYVSVMGAVDRCVIFLFAILYSPVVSTKQKLPLVATYGNSLFRKIANFFHKRIFCPYFGQQAESLTNWKTGACDG